MEAWREKYFSIILITVFVLSSTAVHGKKFKVNLSPNYTLGWEVVDNEYITFGAFVRTTGWIGLGLNTQPRMDGADLVITGVQDSIPYLHAYHAVGHHLVPEDVPHWEIGHGKFFESKNDSATLVHVVRPLDARDIKDGLNIEDKPLYVIWAYGEDDDISKKHIARGIVLVNLLNPTNSDNNSTSESSVTMI